ncbi:MAG: nucleotide exchange factor GrpE [Verrucomicrobia bacterium]|nr:nucleotide exchange factor GrpE [Verrucomicrobiota bacterium]
MNRKEQHPKSTADTTEKDLNEQPPDTEGGLKSAAEIALERPVETAKSPSPAEGAPMIEIPQKELEELRGQAARAKEHWDRLLRTQADLENYRKRAARERQEWILSANEKLLMELLTPLDHFEMGLQSAQPSASGTPDSALCQGMEMVLAQFQQFLKNQGITEIQAVGQMFDPALHEAVAHQESDQAEGRVIQQLRKGYRLRAKLFRSATVVVSKGKPAATEPVAAAPDAASEVSPA